MENGWLTPKQYHIALKTKEGKDLIQDVPNLTWEEAQSRFTEVLKGTPSDADVEDYNKSPDTNDWDDEPSITPEERKDIVSKFTEHARKSYDPSKNRDDNLDKALKTFKEVENFTALTDNSELWNEIVESTDSIYNGNKNQPKLLQDEDGNTYQDLTDEHINELLDKYNGDENKVLDELRKTDWGLDNSDLQGVVEAQSMIRGANKQEQPKSFTIDTLREYAKNNPDLGIRKVTSRDDMKDYMLDVDENFFKDKKYEKVFGDMKDRNVTSNGKDKIFISQMNHDEDKKYNDKLLTDNVNSLFNSGKYDNQSLEEMKENIFQDSIGGIHSADNVYKMVEDLYNGKNKPQEIDLDALYKKYGLGAKESEDGRFYEGNLSKNNLQDNFKNLKGIMKKEFNMPISIRKKPGTYTDAYTLTIRNKDRNEIQKPWKDLSSQDKLRFATKELGDRAFDTISKHPSVNGNLESIFNEVAPLYENGYGTLPSRFYNSNAKKGLDFMNEYLRSSNRNHTGTFGPDADYNDADFFSNIKLATDDDYDDEKMNKWTEIKNNILRKYGIK